MSHNPRPISDETAAKLVKVLADRGIASDPPEVPIQPFAIVFQAWRVCYPGSPKSEWDDLIEMLDSPSVPRAGHLKKMAIYCKRALHNHFCPEELQEEFAYSWGFFDALAYAEQEAAALKRGTPF